MITPKAGKRGWKRALQGFIKGAARVDEIRNLYQWLKLKYFDFEFIWFIFIIKFLGFLELLESLVGRNLTVPMSSSLLVSYLHVNSQYFHSQLYAERFNATNISLFPVYMLKHTRNYRHQRQMLISICIFDFSI